MAKKVLLDVLEQTIGRYVKNLDAERLNVAVWSGKIELHSLELDIAAVNAELDRKAAEAPNLALPFKVLSGGFEAFEVDVPWSHLMAQPVVMRAKGLNVVVEPYNRQAQADHLNLQASVASEAIRAENTRAARRHSMEVSDKYRIQANAMRKLALAQDDPNSSDASSSSKSSTFSSRLLRRIIENIQIEISNVHVSLSEEEGSAGVVLDSLQLVTTDKDGKRTFVDRTTAATADSLENSFLFKMLQIQGLGVYLDHAEHSYTNPVSGGRSRPKTTNLRSIGESSDDENDVNVPSSDDPEHSYILSPLSFQAKLRQADGTVCIDYAKYQLSSELSSLSILLSRNQLDLGRKLSNDMTGLTNAAHPLFPEYRPLSRVTSGTAKDWWKYAFRAIGRLNGRRSWVEFFLAYQKRKAYIPLYKRNAHHKSCPWMKELSISELAELQSLEQDRSISIEGIMAWRTIADAQMEKEQEKHQAMLPQQQPKGMLSSIFGSREKQPTKEDLEDLPPISLSPEELKQLEDMTKEDFADPELSTDSKLCDISFLLSSLRVNLTGYDLRQIAELDMGVVSADFKAAQNGAFDFDFKLSSLEVQDRVTTKSLFPSVLRSFEGDLGRGPLSGHTTKSGSAFQFGLYKEQSGDQRLLLKLATFEAIASPILFREVKRFFSASVISKSGKSANKNPLLAQSISGSVDLFYDADEGEILQPQTEEPEISVGPIDRGAVPNSNYDVSSVLIDAWNEKTKTNAKWQMDVDIKAPIIVIPEGCSEVNANVLVFNLGHLRMAYGKITPAPAVAEWINLNKRSSDEAETILDTGTIAVNELTFLVGKAGTWRECFTEGDTLASEDFNTVIEPISSSFDFAIESKSNRDTPRICVFGVIPTITCRFSPLQGKRILRVTNTWSRFLEEMSDDLDPDDPQAEPQAELQKSAGYQPNLPGSEDGSLSLDGTMTATPEVQAESLFYFMLGLQQLTLIAKVPGGDSLEAHLVSAYASMTSLSDKSSEMTLSMGWFWILDRLSTDLPRRQRLLAHSKLPRPPEEFAENDTYDILGVLRDQGVFNKDYRGSTELADIRYSKASPSLMTNGDRNGLEEGPFDSKVDARFSTLFIHWNPAALKGIYGMANTFSSVADDYYDQEPLIVTPQKPQNRRRLLSADNSSVQRSIPSRVSRTKIAAHMESLELYLHSVRDDYPLFIMTVANSNVDIISSKGTESELNAQLSLGDLRMTTSDKGRTLPSYRSLIGLAPGQSKSLLTLKYVVGHKSISKLGLNPDEYEACADIELSPMRIVYIQAQVMALVEYVTEGILGTLTAQAASSAAEVAKEIADSVEGQKHFAVKASAIDLVLPQSACSQKILIIHAGQLDVTYKMFPEPGGGQAHLSLSDVSLKDENGILLQDLPIRMLVDVDLPPEQIGSMDDQAMRIKVMISEAGFLLSKPQYSQILRMLDENMGEEELFLRDEGFQGDLVDDASTGVAFGSALRNSRELTHAGVVAVDRLRRMYLDVQISSLGLGLRSKDLQDTIIHIAAVDADISLKKFPEEERMTCRVSLKNLICDDRRTIAKQRQYQCLINSSKQDQEAGKALFLLDYESSLDESNLNIQVGSPLIVLIPDAVGELLTFISVDKGQQVPTSAPESSTGEQQVEKESVEIVPDGRNFETTITSTQVTERKYSKTTLSFNTENCRFILVDLGTQNLSGASSTQPSGQNFNLTETIVIQGRFHSKLGLISDAGSGARKAAEFEAQGDSMEIFTAYGSDFRSPIQVLDPADFSAHGRLKTNENGMSILEVRAAALTPFEVVLSMHNAALAKAILDGLQESLSMDTKDFNEEKVRILAPEETERLENLASALEGTSNNQPLLNDQRSMSSIMEDPLQLANPPESSIVPPPTMKMELRLTMPNTRVTIINDLQGLDDALFRFTVMNFVARGEIDSVLIENVRAEDIFDLQVNTSILADYFDSSLNLWNELLVEPWEMTFRSARSLSSRFRSKRLSTTVDLESLPCILSFSEQFLVSLSGALRMWSIYSLATSNSSSEAKIPSLNSRHDKALKKSMAASAARNLITSLPYAIDNHSGLDISFLLAGHHQDSRLCPTGSVSYFRFDPPRGNGAGGKRVYGQDVNYDKTLQLFLPDASIQIDHIDAELGRPRTSHDLGSGLVLLSSVVREGKTTVLHISSYVQINNRCSVPFSLSLLGPNSETHEIGTCRATLPSSSKASFASVSSRASKDGTISKPSTNFSIPCNLLASFVREWQSRSASRALQLVFAPNISGTSEGLFGVLDIGAILRELDQLGNETRKTRTLVTCRSQSMGASIDPFVFQVVTEVMLVGKEDLSIDVFLEPRVTIENNLPLTISLRTPMPHTFSASKKEPTSKEETTEYYLEPSGFIEVFTPGPSIAVATKPFDSPVSGTPLDWMEGGWIDLPLAPEFRLPEPLGCIFPFVRNISQPGNLAVSGSEFFISEGTASVAAFLSARESHKSNDEKNGAFEAGSGDGVEMLVPRVDLLERRTFNITACFYAVDHTGSLQFEQFVPPSGQHRRQSSENAARRLSGKRFSISKSADDALPFSVFVSSRHDRRISLLPTSNVPIRLVEMTMDGDDGVRKSMPFLVDDIAIGSGGIDSTPILWADSVPSGYFAFRALISDYQSEIHFVPEYMIFNGSTDVVVVKERGMPELIIEPGKAVPLRVIPREKGVDLSVNFIELGCLSRFMSVGELGLKVALLYSQAGSVMASSCLQTVIDTQGASRVVVKIGAVKLSSSVEDKSMSALGKFENDFVRFRIRWTELRFTLNEAKEMRKAASASDVFETALHRIRDMRSPRNAKEGDRDNPIDDSRHSAAHRNTVRMFQQAVATFALQRFTLDYQRIFKDESGEQQAGNIHLSPERAQFSVIAHNLRIRDETPGCKYPIIFDSPSQANFLDLCIRVRGPADADLVTIDLFDLHLAYAKGVSDQITVNTSEDFVWKLVDLANRILAASGELAGFTLKLEEDEEHGGYSVSMVPTATTFKDSVQYTPPKGDTLYDIKMVRVSPFTLVVTFRRNPQKTRYKKVRNVRGSNLMNYFMQRLKFTIEQAELNFARYENHNMKGPLDRLIEALSAVYLSRMKFKLVSLITAASLQDWKYLASREVGDDEFVEGDILRATGNLAGMTAGHIFSKVGKGLGSGVKRLSYAVGDGIESSTELIGAKQVGTGVNSVVRGVGDGVGHTITGVGSGAGKVFKGAGQGIGHVIGGVTGGALMVGKGIGKGITTGDGKAVVSGITQGASSVGNGVGKGVESAVMGAADGVLSAGQGLFSGIKNVGKGIGGAFQGQSPKRKPGRKSGRR